jgi:hypothetical protein
MRKKYNTRGKGGDKTTDSAPKGKTRIRTVNGKRIRETSLGNGKWEGREVKYPKYKPKKVKANTNYKSTRSKKGKPRK